MIVNRQVLDWFLENTEEYAIINTMYFFNVRTKDHDIVLSRRPYKHRSKFENTAIRTDFILLNLKNRIFSCYDSFDGVVNIQLINNQLEFLTLKYAT